MLWTKIALILILYDFLSDLLVPTYLTNAASIRTYPSYGNYSNKRETEKQHLKTYRILAEHIGPSESPSKSEHILNPKFDYIEFEEKNVDTLEEVVTSLEEVDDIPQGDGKSKRFVSNAQNSNLYETLEDLKEQPKRDIESVESYVEDPEFRNQRPRLSGIFIRALNSGLYPITRSTREKDPQKNVSKNFEDLLNNPILSKTSRDMTNNMIMAEKDNLRSPKGQNNIISDIKKTIKQSSYPTRELKGLTSASFNFNHNQSLDNSVTLQPEKEMSSNFKSDTKRTLLSGLLRKRTEYNAKDGTAVKLESPPPTKLIKNSKKVEVIEETISNSGDNGTLNISNIIPNKEDDALKSVISLRNLDKDSEGRVKFNLREETGESKYSDIGNNAGSRYDVNYVEDKTKRDVKSDNIFLKLFRSSMFVATVIFVLIVIVTILILFIIFKNDMAAVKKSTYNKLSTEDFVRDRHRPRENSETSDSETSEKSKTSKTLWKHLNVYVNGFVGKATLTTSSDETTDSESENGKIKDFRKVTRETLGREKNSKKIVKYQTSEEKMKTNRYSAIRYQPKSNGPILSYTRLTKKKAKGDCSSIECACVEFDSSSKVRSSKSSHHSTDKSSPINKAKDTINWVQRKVTFTPSDTQTSSDDEDNIKMSKQKSNSVSEGVGTKIKDIILSPLKQVYNMTSGESDSDSSSKVVKEKKKNALKKKGHSIGLESVVRDAEFSSSQSPPSKPTDLINKIVTTGDSRKIDTMLTGEAWNRAFYYSKGMRTLDSGNEYLDNHPMVKPSIYKNRQDKTLGVALKESSSYRALQDEIGKSINVAENNIKKVDVNPSVNDLKNK